jgi:hypothetical protein
MSETHDELARKALMAVARTVAQAAREEQKHILLRHKLAQYRQQHNRLLLAHKALKHDYQALKFHYDALVRELAREEAEEEAARA